MRKLFNKLWNDERGNALIIVGASLPMIMGAVGLASDTIQWALWKRELQRAADSAAIAGVYAKVQGGSYSDAVTTDLARNNDISGITVNKNVSSAPSAGAYTADVNAVRVNLQAKQQLAFSSMFMSTAPTINATATATITPNGDYCVVSLINIDATGIIAGGNANVGLGCGMITNSTSMDAAIAFGSSQVKATPIAAVGGIDAGDNWQSGTQLLPFTMAQADPFKNVSSPTPSGCGSLSSYLPSGVQNKTGETMDLSSQTGTVCLQEGGNKVLEIKGHLKLGPAVYVLDETSLKMTASDASISCTGCTIVLTSTSTASPDATIGGVDLSGGTLNLTSPTSGPYKGISIYQDRRAATGNVNKINGNTGSTFEGAFYFPKQQLTFQGTADTTFTCVQMVSYIVEFTGNSKITNNCPTGSGGSSFKGQTVRLVE